MLTHPTTITQLAPLTAPAPTQPARRLRRPALLCLVAGTVLMAGVTPAFGSLAHGFIQPAAQPERRDVRALIEQNWGVVTAPEALVRCGPTARYYSVATLRAGEFVRIVNASAGSTQIEYPASASIIVDARNVRSVNGSTLTLSEPTALRALNAERGLAGSWRSALPEPLPAGTELTILETLPGANASSEAAGYRVRPPTPAIGHIDSASVRTATRAEIEAHFRGVRGMQDVEAAVDATVATPAPDSVSTTPSNTLAVATPTVPAVTTPTVTPQATPPAATPANPAATTGTTATSPALADGTGPGAETSPSGSPVATRPLAPTTESTAENTTPAIVIPSEITPAEATVTTGNPVPVPTTNSDTQSSPGDRSVLSYQALTQAFLDLRSEPQILDEEIDELIVEHERTLETLTNENERISAGASLEWLKIKRDVRDSKAELARIRAESAQDDETTIARMRALESSRNDFAVIGRLVASRVYDGVRLPLMYRVVSINPVRPGDTIGYLRPGQGGELDRLVGRVVGASGVTRFDADLGLRIIAGDVVRELPQFSN